MKKPFPELTDLRLYSEPEEDDDNDIPIFPHSFLGGYAPHLRRLTLFNIPLRAVQKLLLSANNLVYLSLDRIPDPGHNSPEGMATYLSGLTRLETLILLFHLPGFQRLSQVPHQRLPPLTPSVLPALTRLDFQGRTYHLECLVARIDAPLLLDLSIVFLQYDVFDVPQLGRFISHAEKLGTLARATLSCSADEFRLTLSQPWAVDRTALAFGISYNRFSSSVPLSSLAQVCKSAFHHLISTLEELDIIEARFFLMYRDEIEQRMWWLELLGMFTSLKILRLDKTIALPIMHALKDLGGERESAMLPALQSLFIKGFQSSQDVQDVAEQFVTGRQLSNRYVTVHDWEQ